jgi:hypothetical protein
MKSKLNSGNAYYHSYKIFFLPIHLSKNINNKTIKVIILSVVLYGYEIWSLILREEHILSMFHKEVLRRVFGGKRQIINRRMKKIT